MQLTGLRQSNSSDTDGDASAKAALPPGPELSERQQTFHWFSRPLAFLDECAARFGDTFTLRIAGWGPAVFFAHPDAIKDLFRASPETLQAGRGNAFLRPVLGEHSLVTLDGPRHLQQRRMLLPPFHGQRMRAYGEQMVATTERVIARWAPGQPLSLTEALLEISRDVILQTVLGLDPADPRLREFRERVTLYLRAIDTSVASAPVEAGAQGTPAQERFGRIAAAVERTIRFEIARRRQAPDPLRNDVLELLLEARDEAGQAMTGDELRDQLLTLLLAGHETTAASLAWTLLLLDGNPLAKARLRAELSSAGDAPPEAIARLPFLSAVCDESMRLRPVVPAVPRWTARPLRVGDVELPRGTYAIACIYLAHRRAERYEQPAEFRPERFLEREPGPFEFLPFGGGVRRCVGMAFASYEMRLVLATILRRWDLRSALRQPLRPTRHSVVIAPSEGARMRPVAWEAPGGAGVDDAEHVA